MSHALIDHVSSVLDQIEADGLWKKERTIVSPQSGEVTVSLPANAQSASSVENTAVYRMAEMAGLEPPAARSDMLNLCANNYLGLADDTRLIKAAKEALDSHGFGMASVRFICGTQDLHRQLEGRVAEFLGKEDCILFPSCFDANGGIFEPLLGPEDAIISDSLNHASIIDGVRLCKAQRFRYANNDMADLRRQLEAASRARFKLIVTDGVFSMDGIIADLPGIASLAEEFDAMVMVDDCHATGFLGERGAGTAEYHGVEDKIHVMTGTFGKALGGASGGYVAGPAPIIDLLRQKARPYLFSNAVAPAICAASLTAVDIVETAHAERAQLRANAQRFRAGLEAAGFSLAGQDHPIIPVMVGDASAAARMADDLLQQGIYVVAFSYPVVPIGQARIRTQMSSAHTTQQIDHAIAAFTAVGRAHGIIE